MDDIRNASGSNDQPHVHPIRIGRATGVDNALLARLRGRPPGVTPPRRTDPNGSGSGCWTWSPTS